MAPKNRPSQFVVPSPFGENCPGDCILRSPDGIRFKIFRYGSLLASPFFKGMFELPQPRTSESEADVPVLELSEDAPTILAMLLILYPIGNYRLPDYQTAIVVANAFDKYELPIGRLAPFVWHFYSDRNTLKAHALGLYALAWRLRMDAEAQVAARYTHDAVLTRQVIGELTAQSGSPNCPVALLELRLRREEALDNLVETLKLSTLFCKPDRYGISHLYSGKEDRYFQAILRTKAHVKRSLIAPYPVVRDVKTFFGITGDAEGEEEEESTVPFCRNCPGFSVGAFSAITQAVINAVEDYPQTITG